MSQIGTYLGGRRFVILPVGGVQITATTPASAVVDGTQRHGLEVWEGMARIGPPVPPNSPGINSQGMDARTEAGGTAALTYTSGLNLDPGATASPLVITTPCVVIKNESKATGVPDVSDRSVINRRSATYFIDHTPATDSLPPPIGAPSLVSRYVKTDIDFGLLPAITLPSGAPSAVNLHTRFRRLQTWWPTENSRRLYTNFSAEANYGTEKASERASVLAMMMHDLTGVSATLSERLAVHTVIHAQDILEAAKQDAVYNYNSGLGGILPGYKIMLVIAGILTGDAEMLEWADPAQHDIWAEDRQTVYVTQDWVDTYDYVAGDLDMPEWSQNPVRSPGLITRNMGASYRQTFRSHNYGQCAVLNMLPGARAAWNHEAFFDYAERTMRRTFFDGSGELEYASYLGGTSYQCPAFHRTIYLANVASGWDWPV